MILSAQSLALDREYMTNRWMPFMLALGFHIFLLKWDPTILKASAYTFQTPVINVKVMDHLPVVEQPKPVVKPIEKHVKKAHKSGLSRSAKAQTLNITHRHIVPTHAHAAPKRFVSKITMPKFVPHEDDEPIAASPIPGISAPSPHKAVNAFSPPPVLHGKSRGVRAEDIPFQLSDRGSAMAGGAVVAIPVGEEKAEITSLPSAPMIQDAPRGKHGVAGYRFSPGKGSGYGALEGHDKSGTIGYYGAVKADTIEEGSLNGLSGNGKGGKVVTGKGFEIGGPVGDRRITRRKLPEYPDWAEEKGISALVKIYFTVRADGTIRNNLRIISSTGYPELDDLAKQALLQWRFSSTSADSTESSSWGIITFRFTLA